MFVGRSSDSQGLSHQIKIRDSSSMTSSLHHTHHYIVKLRPLITCRSTSLPSLPVKTSATWKGWERNLMILRALATVSLSSSDSSSIPRIAMMSCRER